MIGPISARSLFRRVRMLSLSAALTLLVPSLSAHAQTYTVIHSFDQGSAEGVYPNGDLVQDPAGNLYGTTSSAVFKLDSSGAVTTLYSFTGETGGALAAGLFRDPEGNLYGTTSGGGAHGFGTVFKLDTNNVLTTLYSFRGGSVGHDLRLS